MTNIAEILKYAPSGFDLWSVVDGWCTFERIFDDIGIRDNIRMTTKNGYTVTFSPFGKKKMDGECLIYPTAEKTWENWQEVIMPKCIGSVIFDEYNNPYLVAGELIYPQNPKELFSIIRFHKFDYENARFATPEETKDFFKHFYENGYLWDAKKREVHEVSEDERKAREIGTINARQYLPTTFDLSKGQLTAGEEADFVFSSEECMMSALQMAEYKNEKLKYFLREIISVPYTGGFGEDGSPLAKDFIEWNEKRVKIADKLFEKFKNGESGIFNFDKLEEIDDEH